MPVPQLLQFHLISSCGMVVKKACEQIKERLAPYMEANLKGTWEDWVRTCTFSIQVHVCIE